MSHQPTILSTCDAAYQAVREFQRAGKRVGLVPTMGALHAGHLSLVEASNRRCDATIATIFVNPTQFGPQEDLDCYPRTLAEDLTALGTLGVPFVFVPTADEMYPADFSTYVEPPAVALPLEGTMRETHFRGVTTVVLKLFHALPADVAFFGQKDYQQALVIQRMVSDLNVPIAIEVCPIVREPDGLAMSSRNVYLDPEQRQRALSLSRSLQVADEMARAGECDAQKIADHMRQHMLSSQVDQVDYAVIADPESLQEVSQLNGSAVALVAARVGNTRLIDNAVLG